MSENIICSSDDINNEIKEILYKMYIDTYKRNNLEIWFNRKEFMFIYPCNLIIIINKKIKGFIMFQKRKKINKISLIAHDNTDDGKKLIINTILKSLNKGFVIEASGALSWVLRKKKAPYIKNKKLIENILELKNHDNNFQQEIKINKYFDYNDKLSNHYNHIYICNQKIDHINNVTLFGSNYNCKWTNDTCHRICI
tara:strand:+ start:539 stop:1129 length:591 start_codon:yes stop_codon:yes gene_type:complete